MCRSNRGKVSVLAVLMIALFLITVGIIGSVIGMLAGYSKQLPDVDSISSYRPSETTKIYADNGELIANLYIENRTLVPLSQISENLQLAIIAVEDARFYEHRGIDIYRTLGALVENIRSRQVVQGGSTITQQLARSLFLTREKTASRKIKEVLLSFQIERRYSKEEILELYLNQIYFGQGAYGVKTAARVYFGKEIKDLSLAECALLAGLPRSPINYSPFNNPELAKKRQAVVLERMVEVGFIPQEQALKAKKAPLHLSKARTVGTMGFRAPYFVTYVLDQLIDEYGAPLVYRGGLQVYTTLDLRMQAIADKALKSGIKQGLAQHLGTEQGAIAALDPRSGYIKVLVGGYDFKKSQFNRAWQAKRQPGSAFKPFVYLTALDNGYSPNDVFIDSPVEYLAGDKIWRPKNYDGKFRGSITLRRALEYSINIIAVKLIDKLGPAEVVEYAQRMGLSTVKRIEDENLALALGGLTYGVSPLQMASAFGIWGNEGIRCTPMAIKKITYSNGLLLKENLPQREEVISPATAFLITDMLKGVITHGTGRRASIGRPAAGKTGTTSDWRDAWFIGYTPELSSAVWIGKDDHSPMRRVVGGTLPAQIWAEFMKEALAKTSPSQFAQSSREELRSLRRKTKEDEERESTPSSQEIEVEICKESGKLATPYCPEIIVRKFKPGEEPKGKCSIHGPEKKKPEEDLIKVDICRISGKLANEYCPEVITKKMPRNEVPKEICKIHGPPSVGVRSIRPDAEKEKGTDEEE